MASIGSSILPASGLLSNFAVMNFTVASAATEYLVTLPLETKHFRMQMRGDGAIQIADVPGQSGTTYVRIFQGDTYEVPNIGGFNTLNFYVQSNKPAQVLEIIYWI